MYQLWEWAAWWTRLNILIICYVAGYLLTPLYDQILIYIDSVIISKAGKHKRFRNKYFSKSNSQFLTLAGSLCVFTEVINVTGAEMAMLRQPTFNCKDSIMNKAIQIWNKHRARLTPIPPTGWPLTTCLFAIAILLIFVALFSARRKWLQKVTTQNQIKKLQHCFQSSFTSNCDNIVPRKFDVDSDTMVIDNSANCIIWKHKKAFKSSTYIKLDARDAVVAVDTAAGEGLPIGIGDVTVGWYNDDNVYHNFILKEVFHIPDSPMNILGISSFSTIVGDYQNKGERINSSGQDSIFKKVASLERL